MTDACRSPGTRAGEAATERQQEAPAETAGLPRPRLFKPPRRGRAGMLGRWIGQSVADAAGQLYTVASDGSLRRVGKRPGSKKERREARRKARKAGR